MKSANKTGVGAVAADTYTLTHPDVTPKQAETSVEHYLRVITDKNAGDVAYDLIRGGQQHPDYLHDLLVWQIQPKSIRPFLAQLQKRIQEGGR